MLLSRLSISLREKPGRRYNDGDLQTLPVVTFPYVKEHALGYPSVAASGTCSPTETVSQRTSESDELLPPYRCSIARASTLLMKPELSDPSHRARHRHWRTVRVSLRGTMLQIEAVQDVSNRHARAASHVRSVLTGRPARDCPARSYTLQGAEAGIARDYFLRRHVLRVRVEAEQFLLAVSDATEVVQWVEALNSAAAISSPIDERSEPMYRTLPPAQPRCYRGDPTTSHGPGDGRSATLLRPGEWFELFLLPSGQQADTQLGQVSLRPPPPSGLTPLDRATHTFESAAASITTSTAPSSSHSVSQTPSAISLFPSSSSPTPSASPSEWSFDWKQDGHCSEAPLTPAQDLLYAHRCANTLRYKAPRRHASVFQHGTTWYFDSSEKNGRIRACGPLQQISQ